MDLLAYMQIDTLKYLLDKNQIYIPRLRGIESMRIANSISKGWIDEAIKDTFYIHFVNLEEYHGHHNIKCVDGVNVIWEKLHGKRRSRAKLLLKHVKRDVTAWANAYNKYVGRGDILRVHTRLGGDNWIYREGYKLEKATWFLEKVDDYFDSTYCDIYVKIEKVADGVI